MEELKQQMTQQEIEASAEEQRYIQYMSDLRAKNMLGYEMIRQHTAKIFKGTYDEDGNKEWKTIPVYNGMFPQVVKRKLWLSDNKYNADGTLKDPEEEAARQEYLANAS